LDATIQTLAPWREKEFIEQFKGRQDLLDYAAAHNIQVRKGGSEGAREGGKGGKEVSRLLGGDASQHHSQAK
jgi:hypothetical protein